MFINKLVKFATNHEVIKTQRVTNTQNKFNHERWKDKKKELFFYNCYEKGHLRRDCAKKEKKKTNMTNINEVDGVEKIDVKLKNLNYSFILDTGSNINILSKRYHKTL